MDTIFKDFVKHRNVDESLILKYKEKLPEELIEVWENHGFGRLKNGYLKIINPDDYVEVVEKSYQRHKQAIPIFVTAMGDMIVWEKEKYVNLLNYKKGCVHVVSSGFDFFFEDMLDENFMDKELMWQPYPEAIRTYKIPSYDECFGYTPLLGLGGTEEVGKLTTVKQKEHIRLIAECMGPIE